MDGCPLYTYSMFITYVGLEVKRGGIRAAATTLPAGGGETVIIGGAPHSVTGTSAAELPNHLIK